MKYFIKRIVAYLLDCILCYLSVMVIIQWGILSNLREQLGITDKWFESSINLEIYVLLTISLPVWIYFLLMDSKIAKGSFGKRLMKLAVQEKTRDERVGIPKSLARTTLKLLPWEISHLGLIFPTPIYFDEDPEIRVLTIIGILLTMVYVISLLTKDKQTIYDSITGTKVIENAR